MGNTQASPALIIAAIVVAVALVGGLGYYFFMRPSTPVVQTPPPSFIDPATGRPRAGMISSGANSPIGQPMGAPSGGAPQR